jgi:NAD(P)-dependent dehydrogenase (short-subunit alcohol dehydrogenase family)
MPSLAGKVAIVTGSSQGIGAALAIALAAEGAKVVVSDVQDCADAVGQIAEQGGEAIGVPADVTDNKSLKELVATAETALGPVDVLVNNAGIFGTLQLKPLMQITEDEWDAVFRVNARGVFQATKAVIPSMQRAGGGSIINISSGTVLRGVPMFLHYVGSKGAVFAMTTRRRQHPGQHDHCRIHGQQKRAQSSRHDGEDPAAHAQCPHDQARYVA